LTFAPTSAIIKPSKKAKENKPMITNYTHTDRYHFVVDGVPSDSFDPCDLDTAIVYAKAALTLLDALNMDWLLCEIVSDTTGEVDATILNATEIEDDDEPTAEEIDAECVFHATCADCPYQPYCDTVEEEEDDDDEEALYALIAQMRRALGQ
jgi:hypothetical protein